MQIWLCYLFQTWASSAVNAAWAALRSALRRMGVQDRAAFATWMTGQGLPTVRPGAYLTRLAQEVAMASAAAQDAD
eukprot:7769336-Karenia_brevis.AAC.1